MSASSSDDRHLAFVRALSEIRDYLDFSAENADFSDNEDYLAVRIFLDQVLREISK